MGRKIQVLFIHGGMTFKTEEGYLTYLHTREISLEKRNRWHGEYLDRKLGSRYDVIRPRMPLQDNATYRDWKIMFERYLPLLGERFVLIGLSLGGIFLAKYLSENKLPRKALSVFLVCPPFDDTLSMEELAGGFDLGSDLSSIEKNSEHLHLLFSSNDEVVPPAHAEKYRAALPDADIVIYDDKNGHFKVAKFSEIARMIRTDTL